ncbi:MAG: glycosyltransferase family 2 protein [Pedobacter sp.]|nr:MAG: glycosyltransferase family 2 protein [Pedobacter sp.]
MLAIKNKNMISVFICTYNPNKEFLERTVKSILSQSLNSNLWEFGIIDNNSNSPVANLAIVKELNIKVVVEKKQGLTAARECAMRQSNGEILVFVDDDNILDEDYLFWVNEVFKNDNMGILSGSVYPEYIQTPEEWFFEHEEMLAIRKIDGEDVITPEKPVCSNLFPIGAGMSVRRKIIEDYYNIHVPETSMIEGRKGDELSSNEDIDLDFYALSRGFIIGVFPKMKMKHIIPPGRLDIKYLTKLAVGSLKSAYQVNEKWASFFKCNVFDSFDHSKKEILYKILVNRILGFSSKPRKMYAAYFSALYSLKKLKN